MMLWGYKNIHSDDKYGECSRCGRELYRYDEAYDIEGKLVCSDCATDEEADFYYLTTMDEMREDAYSIYLEEEHEATSRTF